MTVQIIQGDALTVLETLPDESVNCCVTSPPYWGLRDYGTAKWEGGDAECDHIASDRYYTEKTAAKCSSDAFSEPGEANKKRLKEGRWRESGVCTKCGAVKVDNQLGLERTPEEYVAKMVEVFSEVKRVLRDDGMLWLNIGDSYAGYWGDKYAHKPFGEDRTPDESTPCNKQSPNFKSCGFKPKDLVGIPWMVAFALRSDGWYLRQDIIWHKPNPMPESVGDRCTKAHEYIFLMTKRQRYYYDAKAIQEPAAYPNGANSPESIKSPYGQGFTRNAKISPNRKELRSDIESRHRSSIPGGQSLQEQPNGKRNRRSVWTVSTAPFPGAHFATFPPKLIESCILAGCPAGGTVLDPFGGSGTVGMVAEQHGRNSILIELNPKYIEIAKRRTSQQNIFAGVAN